MVKEFTRRHATLHGVAEVTRGHAVPLGVAPLAVNAVQSDAQLDGASEPAVDAGAVGEVEVVVDVEGDGDSTALGLALEAGPALDGIRHEEVVVREAERGGRLCGSTCGSMCGSTCGSMCEAPGEVDGMGAIWGTR